jgi:Protein of unknown function (DUF2510)
MTVAATPTTPQVRKKGPPFRTSAAVLVLGIIVAIPGVLILVFAFWHALSGPTYTIPGSLHLDLGPGRYVVFERTGHRSSFGPVTVERDRGLLLETNQLVVNGPGGTSLEVREATPNENITRNSDRYVSSLEFTTPRAGRYELDFSGAEPGRVIVQRPLEDLVSRRAAWVVAIGVGWLVALIGMVMLITGVVRRGRAERAATRLAPAQWMPGPAWYPDPQGQHRLRYWDGRQWTDHFAD